MEQQLFHYKNQEQKEYFTRLWKEYQEFLNKPEDSRGYFPVDKLHFLTCDLMRLDEWMRANKLQFRVELKESCNPTTDTEQCNSLMDSQSSE